MNWVRSGRGHTHRIEKRRVCTLLHDSSRVVQLKAPSSQASYWLGRDPIPHLYSLSYVYIHFKCDSLPPEDGGSKVVWNFGSLPHNYTPLQSKRHCLELFGLLNGWMNLEGLEWTSGGMSDELGRVWLSTIQMILLDMADEATWIQHFSWNALTET
jgi:hypothetical protein